MSKFFKALERAERERSIRTAEGRHPTPIPPPEPSPAPVAPAVVTVEELPPPPAAPPPPEPPPAPVAPAVVTVEELPPPPAAPPPPEPPPAPVAPAVVTVERHPPPPPAPPPPSAPPRPPAYGAPVRTHAPVRTREGDTRDPTALYGIGDLDDHLVSLLHPTSVAAEQYRAVCLHVENLQRERVLTVVGVSSPGRGDGKTLTAINLAGALAQGTDRRVVLLEADLRHPSVARFLGLPNENGLSSYIVDEAVTVDSMLQRLSGVAAIVAGPPPAMPYELLQSPRLQELLTALRERFDYVVVDTPAVLPFPDVGLLQDLIDGFLLVVRAQRTPRETVQAALTALGPDLALGIVFNGDAPWYLANADDNS